MKPAKSKQEEFCLYQNLILGNRTWCMDCDNMRLKFCDKVKLCNHDEVPVFKYNILNFVHFNVR